MRRRAVSDRRAEQDWGGREVAFLSWRDTENPEGGGAERYLEHMAEGLVAMGARVTVFSASFDGSAPQTHRRGVRYIRAGSKTSVYAHGMRALATGRLGRPDVVVDVQNGLPFWSRLVTRAPVVVLVHHVHREQWPVVYPGALGRLGWRIESRWAPRVYRRCHYVAVSEATRCELGGIGVAADRVDVVHNGTETQPPARVGRNPHPTICVVGRLVPHKQVEHAIDAAAALREEFDDLELIVAGDGWWTNQLHAYAAEAGVADLVTFTGHVDEQTKSDLYARSWAMAVPSMKEGWGLVIGEAGAHGVPAVAYASAGGTRESIADGVTGLLVDDRAGLIEALERLLRDRELRDRMGAAAALRSSTFTWEHSTKEFADVLSQRIEQDMRNGRRQRRRPSK